MVILPQGSAEAKGPGSPLAAASAMARHPEGWRRWPADCGARAVVTLVFDVSAGGVVLDVGCAEAVRLSGGRVAYWCAEDASLPNRLDRLCRLHSLDADGRASWDGWGLR